MDFKDMVEMQNVSISGDEDGLTVCGTVTIAGVTTIDRSPIRSEPPGLQTP